MEKHGPEFYDTPHVFDFYAAHRAKPDCPNENIEQPILWDLIGNPMNLDVLDLGCGDARMARKFKAQGAKSYLGVDGSRKMVELAERNLEAGFSEVILARLEDAMPPASKFDLVVSALALHYVADLRALLAKVHHCLRTGGRFVFSVEHPVITSCNRALEESSVRQAWIVDDYFVRGARQVRWMGDDVIKFHRTIEDFINELTAEGFALQKFRESDPAQENFQDEGLWRRRRRIPLFMVIAAAKT